MASIVDGLVDSLEGDPGVQAIAKELKELGEAELRDLSSKSFKPKNLCNLTDARLEDALRQATVLHGSTAEGGNVLNAMVKPVLAEMELRRRHPAEPQQQQQSQQQQHHQQQQLCQQARGSGGAHPPSPWVQKAVENQQERQEQEMRLRQAEKQAAEQQQQQQQQQSVQQQKAGRSPKGSCTTERVGYIQLRRLEAGDYAKGYLQLLSQLTTVGEVSEVQFRARLAEIQLLPDYAIVVAEDTERGTVVGTATLLVERKFIHGCSCVGHIEDVVVDGSVRGKQLGSKLVAELTRLARERGCYKLILDCSETNAPFYERCGLRRKELQMASYLE